MKKFKILQQSCKKSPKGMHSSSIFLARFSQDLYPSCKILARFASILQESCKILIVHLPFCPGYLAAFLLLLELKYLFNCRKIFWSQVKTWLFWDFPAWFLWFFPPSFSFRSWDRQWRSYWNKIYKYWYSTVKKPHENQIKKSLNEK